MIKTGKTIIEAIDDINTEFSAKVAKTTKVAGLPLSSNIEATTLVDNMFKFTNTASQVVDSDGTVHPMSLTDMNVFDYCMDDIY